MDVDADSRRKRQDGESCRSEEVLALESILWNKGKEINELERMLQRMEGEVRRCSEEASREQAGRQKAEAALAAALAHQPPAEEQLSSHAVQDSEIQRFAVSVLCA